MDNKENVDLKLNDSVSIPDECEKSTKEIEKISDESVMTHYAFINVIVLVIIALVMAISFMVLTDEEKMDYVENPLTFKTFSSGEFANNLQKSYIKSLPFAYEFKSAGNKTEFLYGFGNEIKEYKKHEEIVRVSDEDIEQEKQQAQENIEKALEEEIQEKTEVITTTNKKTTAKKKTETGAQRVTTTKRSTTSVKKVTTEEKTSLTTTNNNPPEVIVITTIPPS